MFETAGFLTIVISLVVLITFFVMASRLGSIKDYLKTLVDIELKKPENKIHITCEKCNEVYTVSLLRKGELINCPKCKETNRA